MTPDNAKAESLINTITPHNLRLTAGELFTVENVVYRLGNREEITAEEMGRLERIVGRLRR